MYWIAVYGDRLEINGIKRKTKVEAAQDCKAAFEVDCAAEEKDPGFSYFVEYREEINVRN